MIRVRLQKNGHPPPGQPAGPKLPTRAKNTKSRDFPLSEGCRLFAAQTPGSFTKRDKNLQKVSFALRSDVFSLLRRLFPAAPLQPLRAFPRFSLFARAFRLSGLRAIRKPFSFRTFLPLHMHPRNFFSFFPASFFGVFVRNLFPHASPKPLHTFLLPSGEKTPPRQLPRRRLFSGFLFFTKSADGGAVRREVLPSAEQEQSAQSGSVAGQRREAFQQNTRSERSTACIFPALRRREACT